MHDDGAGCPDADHRPDSFGADAAPAFRGELVDTIVREALGGRSVQTVGGVAGAGKTYLRDAVAAALTGHRRVASPSGDAVRAPPLLLATIARAFGVAEASTDPQEVFHAVQARADQTGLVLLLDDAECLSETMCRYIWLLHRLFSHGPAGIQLVMIGTLARWPGFDAPALADMREAAGRRSIITLLDDQDAAVFIDYRLRSAGETAARLATPAARAAITASGFGIPGQLERLIAGEIARSRPTPPPLAPALTEVTPARELVPVPPRQLVAVPAGRRRKPARAVALAATGLLAVVAAVAFWQAGGVSRAPAKLAGVAPAALPSPPSPPPAASAALAPRPAAIEPPPGLQQPPAAAAASPAVTAASPPAIPPPAVSDPAIPAPASPGPASPGPVAAAPAIPAPAVPAPAIPTPASPAPVVAAPAVPAPAVPAPAIPTPASPTPVAAAPAVETPASPEPVPAAPAASTPAIQVSATTAPAREADAAATYVLAVPTRVMLSVPHGNPDAEALAGRLASALGRTGAIVSFPSSAAPRPPGIAYFFARDAEAAAAVGRVVTDVTGERRPAQLTARDPLPPPGTVELIVARR